MSSDRDDGSATGRHIQAELERSLRALALEGGAGTGPWTAEQAVTILSEWTGQPLARGANVERFVVLAALGRGGQADVYAVYDERLNRKVALKLIRLGPEHRNAVQNARLLREARALAQLEHPNVLRVHDAGTFEGAAYLVMEIKHGDSLARWLETPRRWREIVEMFLAAGRGLHAAHQKGIVHRDFKAENVFIDEHFGAVLGDFGLAFGIDDEAASESGDTAQGPKRESEKEGRLTDLGHVPGTEGYIAPERVRGRATARSDQFSFCVALFQALFGLMPVPDENRRPTRPGDNPPSSVVRALHQGLRADPAGRFPDMAALITALEARPQRRLMIGAGVAVGLLAFAAAWSYRANQPDPCVEEGEDAMAEVWNEQRRTSLVSAVGSVDLSFADKASESLGKFGDDYKKKWLETNVEICAAPAPAKKECLSRKLERFDAFLKSYVAPTKQRVIGLNDVLGLLDEPDECENPEAPQQADIPQDVRAAQDDFEMLIAAGDYASARKNVGTMREKSRGYPAAEARALFLAGWLGAASASSREAIDLLQAAAKRAVEVRDYDTFVRASTFRLKSLVNDLGAHAEAGQNAPWIEMGVISLPLPADSPIRRRFAAEFAEATGLQHETAGHHELAVAQHRKALTLREAYLGEEHPLTAKSHHSLGVSLSNLAESLKADAREETYKEGRKHYLKALQIRIARLGSAHPLTAETRFGVAHAECEHLALRAEKDPRLLDGCVTELQLVHRTYDATNWDPRGAHRRSITLANYAITNKCIDCAKRALETVAKRMASLSEVDPREQIDFLMTRGKLEHARGDDISAEATFINALAMYEARREFGTPWAQALNNSVAPAIKDDRYEEAIDLLLKRQALLATASCDDRRGYARVLNNIAEIFETEVNVYPRAKELRRAATAVLADCP